MRTPETVLASVATRYDTAWRDQLLTPTPTPYSFPLQPPTAATVRQEPAAVHEWLKTWRTWAQHHPAARLRETQTSTRFGRQPVLTHLDLDCFDDLASLLPDKAAHWLHARRRWAQLSSTADPATVRPWLQQILTLQDPDFDLLVAAVDWFGRNPRSGLTIRRVPVPGMHTKWLARHRRLVLAALGTLPGTPTEDHPSDPDELAADELDALGLQPLPREVDLLLLDPADRVRVGGLRQLRAPANELATLPVQPRHVLVVENKEAALPLRDRPDVVVLHSLGNHLTVLTELGWTQQAQSWYWGDLDRWGFTLLSRARTHLPHIRSLLMDPSTVTDHSPLAVTETLNRVDDPDATLTPAETAALDLLTQPDGYWQIEQERIPTALAETTLDTHLAARPHPVGAPVTSAPGPVPVSR